MTRKRRSFTPEFKHETASLVLDQGIPLPQACTSLGVVESALRRAFLSNTDHSLNSMELGLISDGPIGWSGSLILSL
ncbi:hypothetical protein Y019_06285 [Alcanivorax sp. 97CO-6]|nr:hypothetical protein Y019_06285 [Alcanivorax sp. 97CO-6]